MFPTIVANNQRRYVQTHRRVPLGYLVYVKSKKTKAGQPGHWPEKKKIEVATTYKTCGSVALTASMTQVPRDTVKHWMKQPWWSEMLNELSYEDNTKLDSKLEKVMDKALDQVMDRLENGDLMYDPRTGKVTRIPAKLRDVGKIVNDSIDKRLLIKKVNAPKEESTKQITADHLVQLAKAFAQFSTGKKQGDKPGTLYEGEAVEVLDSLGLEEGYKEIKK